MEIGYVYIAGLIVSIILFIYAMYLHATTPHKDYHSYMFLAASIGLIITTSKLIYMGWIPTAFFRKSPY